MKWLPRLLTAPPTVPPGVATPVYALLREHDTPEGPEETVVDWLSCEEAQARRVAAALNAQEGRRRYRALPLRALGEEELLETPLTLTRLTVKGTPHGVRYAVSQRTVRMPRAFAPPLAVRTLHPGAFAPNLSVWTAVAEDGLTQIRSLAPVVTQGVHEVLWPWLRDWETPGSLSGRLSDWPRVRRLPGGLLLWAHADGTPYLWPGQGESLPARSFRIGGRCLRAPDDTCRVNVAALMRMADLS